MPEEFIEIDKQGVVRIYTLKEKDKCYPAYVKMINCLAEKKNLKKCKDTVDKWDICISKGT